MSTYGGFSQIPFGWRVDREAVGVDAKSAPKASRVPL
jgi:hypothetical protein